MTAGNSDHDAEKRRFAALLDEAAARSLTLSFWWRDDDARTRTPQLERLLALASRHGLPLGLAVVPEGATSDLAVLLADQPEVSALQHGCRHQNHSPPDQKKMELGDHRPLPEIVRELRRGFETLRILLPDRFLPVLVPPWNRISDAVLHSRHEAGLTGLSTFGPAPAGVPGWVNTHLDIIDWKARAPRTRADVFANASAEIERRMEAEPEPFGILTHHLAHEEESWDFLDELLGIAADHPAVTWPSIDLLFGLPRTDLQRP
jgi:hypothetical protein